MPIRLMSQANLGWVWQLSLPWLLKYSSTEKTSIIKQCQQHYSTWCWWSRTPTRYDSNVSNKSLHSLFYFLFCCGSSCTTITLCRTIKMQMRLAVSCIFWVWEAFGICSILFPVQFDTVFIQVITLTFGNDSINYTKWLEDIQPSPLHVFIDLNLFSLGIEEACCLYCTVNVQYRNVD